MPKLTCVTNVQVAAGPRISSSHSIDVSAYDYVEVIVPPGASDYEYELQPTQSVAKVKCVIVTSDHYDSKLAYSINKPLRQEAPMHSLDSPHLLFGSGAASLLGEAPRTLFFSSWLASEAKIQILIGRQA